MQIVWKCLIGITAFFAAGTLAIPQGPFSVSTSPETIYVGSTPCDAFIKSLLRIPVSDSVDFMKCELHMVSSDGERGSFSMSVLYGMGQPNTNGFYHGGNKLAITGSYTSSQGIPANPRLKQFQLNSPNFKNPLLLVQMNRNIFHFLDDKRNYLVGNGGWGYVLNRINEPVVKNN